jgi:oxygen-dependent protoporphyrinogen oxidase
VQADRAVVVVGAGIAGLTAAYELARRGFAPLVLERSDRAGGVVVTDRIEGCVIDGGPDSVLAQKPAALQLARELGLGDDLVEMLPPRTAFVLRAGRLVPIPPASFLGLPTRLAALAGSRLFSFRAKLRVAAERAVPAAPAGRDESIGSFIGRRFGREAVRCLAEPLLAGIHAGDVDDLSVHALFPRLVEAEQCYGSVLRAFAAWRRAARNPGSAAPPGEPDIDADHGAFRSFQGGMAQLVDGLVRSLDAAALRLRSGVRSVEGRGPFAIALDTGETLTSRAVILATPAWAASVLVRSVDRDLGALCAAIPYVSTAVVVFAFRRAQVRHRLEGTGFVVPRTEHRAITAATWISSKWPGRAPAGTVLMRAFLGGAHDATVPTLGDLELAARALSELACLLGITGQPLLTRVYRWIDRTPQYLVGHLDRVRRIDERLNSVPGLHLTGSGYRGTGIPDVIADARATAGRTAEFLSR